MSDKPKIDDGGPAFPVECEFTQDGKVRGLQTGNYSGWETGMTLRDWFAGMALHSAIEYWQTNVLIDGTTTACTDFAMGDPEDADKVAHTCYTVADAMLAARSK